MGHPPCVYTFSPLNRRHREGPCSRLELQYTIQVIPFAVFPGSTGSLDSTHQTSDASQPPITYGTRLSTVILVKRNGEVFFVERDIWGPGPDGAPVRSIDRSTDRVFKFNLPIVPPSS